MWPELPLRTLPARECLAPFLSGVWVKEELNAQSLPEDHETPGLLSSAHGQVPVPHHGSKSVVLSPGVLD